MKAKLYGFQWLLGYGITLDEFFGHLKGFHDIPVIWAPFERLIYTCDYPEYYGGLILSVKDQRKFPEIKQNGNRFVISVREMEDNTNAVDFNFFAIHKRTARGAYLHYHQSFSMNQFNMMCARLYKEYKRARIDAELNALPTQECTDAAKNRVRKKYRGRLKHETIVRADDLPALIDELDRVSAFQFDYAVLNPKASWAKPLEQGARRKTYRYGFAPKQPISQVKKWVVDAVEQARIKKGRVEGKGKGGEDRVLHLDENPTSFGEYDHDLLAGEMAFDLEDLKDCWCMKQVMKAVKSSKAFFADDGEDLESDEGAECMASAT